MVSNQVLGARCAAGLLILAALLAGCAHHEKSGTTPAPEAVPQGAGAAAAAPQSMTATEAAINATGGQASVSPDLTGEIKPTAPMQYTVKPGDTLWGIASMYLKDPWLWPEIWVINPQIPNPHLIYPGDTLALAYGAGGQPQVTVAQAGTARMESVRMSPGLRSEPLEQAAIPTIPYSAVQVFLTRPSVLTRDQIRDAPYVLAFRDMHQVAGAGNELYIRNLPDATRDSRYAVVHIDGPLVDPDDGKTVGYAGVYTGTALIQRPGKPAKGILIDPARETFAGDRLVAADQSTAPLNFTPHAPAKDVHGSIIYVSGKTGDTGLLGVWEVAVINRGARHGLEPGNVLEVDQRGDVVKDRYKNGHQIGEHPWFGGTFYPNVQLPRERTGTLLVFKVFDRVSYGLVIGASDVIRVHDFVRSP